MFKFLRHIFIICSVWYFLLLQSIPQSFAEISKAERVSNIIKNYVVTHYDIEDYYPTYVAIRKRVGAMVMATPDSNPKAKIMLKNLLHYNSSNMYQLSQYVASREGTILRFTNWKREWIQAIQAYENKIRRQQNILSGVQIVTPQYEYSHNNDVYRLSFDEVKLLPDFQKLSLSQYQFQTVYYDESMGYFVALDPKIERKIPFTEILAQGPKKFLLYMDNYYEEDGVFYTYGYDEYYDTYQEYGLYASDWEKIWFDINDGVMLRLQDGKNTITFSPRPIKILAKSDFKNYEEVEQSLINDLTIDVLRIDKDYNPQIQKIIQKTNELTYGLKSDDEKIHAIYDWVKQNIWRPSNPDRSDLRNFSGLDTFERGVWFCEGEARIMSYMLKFAGIKNVRLMQWYVLDSLDFPNVWHSWLKVWNDFYDPFFEPQYQEDVSDYLYYKLPFDLTYSNRFNLLDMPEWYSTLSKEALNKEIIMSRVNLLDKYSKTRNYRLLDELYLKKENNLNFEKDIVLGDILDRIKVEKLSLVDNKITQKIEWIGGVFNYYPIDSSQDDISYILKESDYNLSNVRVFEMYEKGIFQRYAVYILWD